jgi:hypothetical protein
MRVSPQLDDFVSTIQLRRWFSATGRSMTTQSYGAQLLWRWLDTEQPRFLPALFTRLAAPPVAGEGQHAVTSTYARVTGKPFADAFHRFAVSVAENRAEEIEPDRAARHAALPPLAVRYIRAAQRRTGRSTLIVTFPRGRAGAAATLVYRLESDVPGQPERTLRIGPRVSDGGRTLAFSVATGPRKSALLVLSNGGERAVPYAANAR